MVVRRSLLTQAAIALLAACGGGGGDEPAGPQIQPQPLVDEQLKQIIAALELSGDPSLGRNLPSIEEPLPQLGKRLFFAKSLSGNMDTACASCHHPVLGGSNALSLPIGADADVPDLVGPGRSSAVDSYVPRNAPTTFNIGMYDAGLFYDSRIESIEKVAGANGAGTSIRTPDTAYNVPDVAAGATLPAAQARFPVVEPSEMRGTTFEAGADHATVREHLAARLGNYGIGAGELGSNAWIDEFQAAFASSQPAEELVTFDNIALALGEYVRSQVFVDTPWRAYVRGDTDAISIAAKRGALLFFRNPPNGAGCLRCHTGDLFSDEEHHTIAFPQVGPGKGDGNGDDYGRERETGLENDRYRYRTPSLLNVEVTGPYNHSGSYPSLRRAIDHYREPDDVIEAFFDEGGICGVPQFVDDADCATEFANTPDRTAAALVKMRAEQADDPDNTVAEVSGTFTEPEVLDVQAFLLTLTDPCVKDRACLAPWIPEPGEDPDGQQLNAFDMDGNPL